MGIKKIKPTTPARRGMTIPDFSDITKKKPEKSLTVYLSQKSGRNASGKITVRHRGGGSRRKYRIIDFKQDKFDIQGKVETIEYDPYRSARIALIVYEDGEKRYILAPQGLKIGNKVITSRKKEKAKPANRFLIKDIPLGTMIHNIELQEGKGGQLVRSAGSSAQISGKEGNYVLIKLPSGEIRKIYKNCFASIGQLSNPEHNLIKIGKAGRTRWKGKRPQVRGKAMIPKDHPHGGGEGGTDIGLSNPKTPWGFPALGYKTRKRKYTDKFIVKPRSRKKR